ncbi:MAG: M43 family zinc metalloprotease [Flavobacteriales bacterium]
MNIYLNRIGALLLASALTSGGAIFAQSNKCATHTNWVKYAEEHPEAIQRKQELEEFTRSFHRNFSGYNRTVELTIPVVFHILHHPSHPEQNISDAQINSQIAVLNKDFRLLNSDSLNPSHPFWQYTIDAQIEFCLASRKPDGTSTNGINRVEVEYEVFDDNSIDAVKYTDQGGVDNWDPTKYLNIWVVDTDTGNTTLGFATFPSDLANFPEEDGVVLRHQVVGTLGTAGTGGFSANDLGRTATHEVGHWLNLSHIWGDDNCGDDNVSDTPDHEEENYGCPSFPHRDYNACGSDENGEMYMNYMDYVNDDCMNMFTYGQAERMWAAIEGPRSGLKTSEGCQPPGAEGTEEITESSFMIYPNPSDGMVELNIQGTIDGKTKVEIYSITGAQVYSTVLVNPGNQSTVAIENLNAGMYMVQVCYGMYVETQRLIVK